ncbi:MAG: OST3/OST6 family protein [Candidatus Bathyarchaeota archaeon]|nr:OST3/OST6 family protein [Candidatus Bathyarchaeota archaeon]
MSKKFKKREAPTSFSDRWFRRISTAKPSTFVITIIIVSYAIFFFSGGLLTIISQPLPSAYYGGKFYFLYPELGSQFISDTIIAIMLYAIGFAGLLSIYQSTKYAYKPRQAYMMMIVGVTLLLIAYIFIEDAIHIKTG